MGRRKFPFVGRKNKADRFYGKVRKGIFEKIVRLIFVGFHRRRNINIGAVHQCFDFSRSGRNHVLQKRQGAPIVEVLSMLMRA